MRSIVMRISARPLVPRTRSNVRTVNCRSGRKRLNYATIVDWSMGKESARASHHDGYLLPAKRVSVSGGDGIEQ
jgi:hypothetical protein